MVKLDIMCDICTKEYIIIVDEENAKELEGDMQCLFCKEPILETSSEEDE